MWKVVYYMLWWQKGILKAKLTYIFRPVKDELYKDETATHISVLRNGHVYTIKCFDDNGT